MTKRERCPECNSTCWDHVGTVFDSRGEHYQFDCATCRYRALVLVKPAS